MVGAGFVDGTGSTGRAATGSAQPFTAQGGRRPGAHARPRGPSNPTPAAPRTAPSASDSRRGPERGPGSPAEAGAAVRLGTLKGIQGTSAAAAAGPGARRPDPGPAARRPDPSPAPGARPAHRRVWGRLASRPLLDVAAGAPKRPLPHKDVALALRSRPLLHAASPCLRRPRAPGYPSTPVSSRVGRDAGLGGEEWGIKFHVTPGHT